MPIDPRKLAAAAGDKGPPPKKGGKPPKGGGGNPHEKAHPEMPEGDETGGDEAEELPEGADKYAHLAQLLEANAEDVEEQCDGLDMEFVTDSSASPDEGQAQELEECLEALPDDLVAALREAHGISWEDSMALAKHMEDEGMISDSDGVAGFIFHVGQLSGTGEDEQDGGGEDEHEGEDDNEGGGEE